MNYAYRWVRSVTMIFASSLLACSGEAVVESVGADAGVIDAADAADARPLKTVRVLFLGNSYTYVNDLPGMLESIMVTEPSLGAPTVDSLTVGGATLYDLIVSHGALDKIRQGGWTHVVLQEQSVMPCFDPAAYVASSSTLAVEAKNIGATVLLYGTWPRAAGDAIYTSGGPYGTSPRDMEKCLESGFANAVKATNATLVDVGAAWIRALAARPSFPLYQGDRSHPQVGGTFLAAGVFLHAVAGVSASSIRMHPSSIGDADAMFLEGVADGM